jgi:hypothetical protein
VLLVLARLAIEGAALGVEEQRLRGRSALIEGEEEGHFAWGRSLLAGDSAALIQSIAGQPVSYNRLRALAARPSIEMP